MPRSLPPRAIPRPGPIVAARLTRHRPPSNVRERTTPVPYRLRPVDPTDSDVTTLLSAVSQGDPGAMDRLLPAIYGELKHLAAAQLRRERDEHTLGATALVHEAYLKLIGQRRVDWQSRAHFFGIAAQSMRRILVDHARQRAAGKRSKDQQVALDEAAPIAADTDSDDVLAVHEALDRLAALDARQARLVELRYFGGFTVDEAADLLEISPATAHRDWAVARAWLQRELARDR
jgi:RNA polymerase sigma-70 factor (ECF subfamily)